MGLEPLLPISGTIAIFLHQEVNHVGGVSHIVAVLQLHSQGYHVIGVVEAVPKEKFAIVQVQ